MSIVDPVECAVLLLRGMSDKERCQVFERIKDLLPQTGKNEEACHDGKPHKFKVIREDNYLFHFLNKSTLSCIGCGKTIKR
jgi:hypothetical protein